MGNQKFESKSFLRILPLEIKFPIIPRYQMSTLKKRPSKCLTKSLFIERY